MLQLFKRIIMKEYLSIYERNKQKIEGFIQESIINLGTIKKKRTNNFKDLFFLFPSLELIYIINKDTKMQISPNYFRTKIDESAQNHTREYLISKLHFTESKIAFSTPYISTATKNGCITATVKEGDYIVFLDFKLETLLERLNLIELNKGFHAMTKSFYTLAGFSMAFLSVFIIFYSLYGFVNSFILHSDFTLESIFKPVIALTLGIAIFDLAKTVLEQEVFFKSYSSNSAVDTKMITKFLITIIVALSIEALMVVFKIALQDYAQMINALYLIAGVSSIIIALAIFIYITKRDNPI